MARAYELSPPSAMLGLVMSGREPIHVGLAGAIAACSLFVFALACESASKERAREVVDEAAREAERGAERARAGTQVVVEKASKQGAVAVSEAEKGVARGLDKAREGLDDAREGIEVARAQLGVGMDEAADSFAALAEAGKDQADMLGDVDAAGESALEIRPDAIICRDESKVRTCRVDPELIAALTRKPKLLASEVSLRPFTGATGRGLRLAKAKTQSFATALGLREGDILMSINGAQLGSFDAIRALDEALSGKPEARLIYERDGEREELTVMQQAGH